MKSKGKKGHQNSQKQYFTPNTFSLRSIKPGISNKFDVEVEFKSGSFQQQGCGEKDLQGQNKFSNILKYNKDGNHLTHAFIIRNDKRFLELQDEYSQGSQFSKNEKQKQESQQIMLSKPGSTYCKVCETSFIDYLNVQQNQHSTQSVRIIFPNQIGHAKRQKCINQFYISSARQKKNGKKAILLT